MKNFFFRCPTDDFTCPYYEKNGICVMFPENNPILECDEAMVYAEETNDCDYETGFDPYLGCYTDDC